MLPMPSTSQVNSNTTAMLLSTENLDDDDDEADSFSTQRLFCFAWQIAKGMVNFSTVNNYEQLTIYLEKNVADRTRLSPHNGKKAS